MAKKKKSKKKFHAGQSSKKKKQRANLPALESNLESSAIQTIAEQSDKKQSQTSANIAQSKNQTKDFKKSDSRYEEYGYVKTDLKRSFIISGSIVGTLILLWVLFEYTGVGPAIYHLVKL